MPIRFIVLGAVGADRDGERIAMGGPKQRAVLAILLLNANRVVPVSQIVDGIWAERPPDRAVNAVQVYVSGLRRILEKADESGGSVLVTEGRGYRLLADDRSLDLLDFLSASADGRRLLADNRFAASLERLDHAIGLWRGPALADVSEEPFAVSEAAALEESRLAALEARIDAQIALTRYDDAIAALRPLIREHPLRERLRGLLAEALYRSGRQRDALEVFRESRLVLAEHLGVDPGPDLRELEDLIRNHAVLDRAHRNERPFLLLHDGGGRERIVALDPGASPLRIGRRSSNDVTLGWDREVSRAHAQLTFADGGWWIVDDGQSRNGTFVDGDRVVGRRRLVDAQFIRMGATVLLYRSQGRSRDVEVALSGVTVDAPLRSATELTPAERQSLLLLAGGGEVPPDQHERLHRRFAVDALPADERDQALMERARIIGAL